MGDGNDFSNLGETDDICSVYATYVNGRLSVERLLRWLRESQTSCVDTHCIDPATGLIANEGRIPERPESFSDAWSMILLFVVGLMTIYAMALSRDRNPEEPIKATSRSSNEPDDDDHSGLRRDNNSREPDDRSAT